MKTPKLNLTERLHQEAFNYLFPGDTLEAAGVFLCNQGNGIRNQTLVATEFVALPHELSKRTEDHLIWPFEEIFDIERIAAIDKHNQSIVTIHSHPRGQKCFSLIDDTNDIDLFKSINGWFDDDRINGSAIMLPNGEIIARSVNSQGSFEEFGSVVVAGDSIRVWKPERTFKFSTVETKLSQTLGQGTLKLLRTLRAGVVGCSGTGSIIAELLARNCIGELVLIDDDFIEEKNLNRIVNSKLEDARQQIPKVIALSNAISKFGLGTEVDVYQSRVDSPRASAALIDCDVIFGCVDSAVGRYHLDCIAIAYLIPYFDVGVHIDADGRGAISSADAVAHYVKPNGSSLLSRGAYTVEQVTAENWKLSDPKYYSNQRASGYLAEVDDDQPAVMSLNMLAAVMAFNDFLSRIHNYRLDNNREFATHRFRLVHGCYENESDDHAEHPLLNRYIGAGDASLLVRNNLRDDALDN